jgi:T5SS/PEP-CTERM-associated repeat protein
MSSFTWFGGSGNLEQATDWLNQPMPNSPTAPGPADTATIGGAGTLTGSIDVQSAGFSGSLTLAGQITAEATASVDGTLAVSGPDGRFIENGYLAVGDAGDATLQITGGGSVSTTDSNLNLDIAGDAGGTANVAVDGENSTLSTAEGLVVGLAGNGALTLTNSGQVNANGLGVGYLAGSQGVVSIASQGTLNTTGLNVGGLSGAKGTVTIDGHGATLANSGFSAVGDAGSGSLTVSNGAGFVDSSSTQEIAVGSQLGGIGTLTVTDSGSTLTDADYLVVGFSGNGMLSVEAGGSVSMTNVATNIILAEAAGSSGTVNVDGAGSIVTDTGYFSVGGAGKGTLTLTDGGQVMANDGLGLGEQPGATGVVSIASQGALNTTGLDVGAAKGATGTVTIDGHGSSLSDSGGLTVGDAGTGTLSVTNGATLSAASIEVAAQAGSIGDLTLGAGDYAITDGAGVATVTLTAGSAFTGSISGFAGGDTIDLANVANVASVTWANGVLTIAASSGTIDLNLPGSFANTSFAWGTDGKGGTDVSLGPTLVDYLDASELAYDFTLNTSSAFVSGVTVGLSALGFTAINVPGNISPTGMAAEAFADSATKQIIVAFRGTVLAATSPLITFQDLVTLDGTGIFAVNSAAMNPVFAAALTFVANVESANPGYGIFVTGHSLGATEAEAVASALTAVPSAFPDPFYGGATFAATGVTNLLTDWTTQTGQATTPTVYNLTDYVITNDPVGTYSTDSVGKATNGPGAHVGMIVPLSPTVTATPGSTATYLADAFSSSYLGGKLSGLLANKSINLADGLLGLPEHPIGNYAQALTDAGYINANPLAQANSASTVSTAVADLGSLFSGIMDLAAYVDAAGEVVQTGVLTVVTSIGSAVVDLKETLTEAGSAIFSMVIQSGENVASQILTWSNSGALTDAITVDGTKIETPDITSGDPASLNIGADGSIIVGVGSPTPGDEITVVDSPSGMATVSTGGDATDPAAQIDQFALLPDETLNVGAAGGGSNPAVTESLPSVTLGDNFSGDGVSDALIENASGAVVVGEVENGQVVYTQVAALGPEWSFEGNGDFLGAGLSDFLVENTSGSVAVGEVMDGQTTYADVANLGPEWKFEGTGDFLGDGKSDFLIENASGSVVVGEVGSNGQAQYTQVAALGSEWKFVGAGDFLGDGKSDFLIENAVGAVVVGEVVGGQAAYTTVGALGPEWSFRETGDFLGDGKSDFLIENAGGAVDVGEVVNGQAQYTAITALGPEWKFVGAGDYLGEGHDQFLIENAAGAVDVGDWLDGQIHFTQVTALGPEWVFH